MALFGEKYGANVRVVSIGDSKELCGGTHIKNTKDIASFKILSESGVAAGVRRIEALTGDALIQYYEGVEKELQDTAKLLKTTPAQLTSRVQQLLDEVKNLKAEIEKDKARTAQHKMKQASTDIKDLGGVKFVAMKLQDVGMNDLRNLGDGLKEKTEGGIVVLASEADGKVNLIATCGDAALAKGAHAGNIIKEIASLVGGGGGGRPNMAQAGGKDASGIDAALAKAEEVAKAQIG